MLIKKEFLAKLKDFGLNTYESKLWTALLSRGVATAGELSDIANVPRSRSYDVLESLEKKGFIIVKIGKPIKYLAVPPIEVLDRVKKKIVVDTQDHLRNIEKLENMQILKELSLLHNQGIETVDVADLTGSIKGRGSIYTHFEHLIKNSKENIIIHSSASGIARKLETLKDVLKNAKDRGVKIRVAAPLTKEAAKELKSYKSIVEIKNSDNLMGRFMVVDGKEVSFMLLNDSEVHPAYDVAVWVRSEHFGNALSFLFNQQWKNMKSL